MRRLALLLMLMFLCALASPALALGGYSYKVLTVQPESLVGYWAGEETGGLFALDSSGNNRHGYYYGPALSAVNAPDGAPIPSYDGINDLLDLPVDTISGLNASGAWDWNEGSVALWVNHEGYIDASYNVVFFAETAAGYFGDAVEFLYMVQGEWSYVSLYMARGGSQAAVSTGLPALGWHHWVWTWSMSTLELWLDGVLVDTKPFSGSSTEPLLAARVRCLNLPCYAGRLGIWRAALTAENIESLAGWSGLPDDEVDTGQVITLPGGRMVVVDFRATAGDFALAVIGLVLIAGVVALVWLTLARGGR